jgi:hypothetical protein
MEHGTWNMERPLVVISASRRTDLARCFPAELAAWLAAGRVQVRNPFNQRQREVDLRPEAVHTLVLWSKDYARLLAGEHGLRELLGRYAQVFFHFTVTGLGGGRLEPSVPAADAAVRQFRPLVALAGDPRRVTWRFDPVLLWRSDLRVESNLAAFDRIAEAAAQAGLVRVATSLCHWYAKAKRRAVQWGLRYVVPTAGRVQEIAGWLQEHARRYGLEVQACCCPEFAQAGLHASHCIDGDLLTRLHPDKLPAATGKDTGQRKDCGCTPSVDIGDYRLSCPQGCVYCYARPGD